MKNKVGTEYTMDKKPRYKAEWYQGSGKLDKKTILITGGDSGIGRSIAILAAREGARVAIIYLNEDIDAQETKRMVEKEGSQCLLIRTDVAKNEACEQAVSKVIETFSSLNCVINNAAQQFPKDSLLDITQDQLRHTFEVNIYPYFYMAQAALPFLKSGDSIINTTSVTAYRGSYHLVDYAATKGAIVSYTRSLSQQLAKKNIRVNAVAPGPVWTPLIPSTFSKKEVKTFGKDVPLGRPGQPEEIAPAYIFLAAQDSSYMTGQVLHPNGGEIVNT